MTSRTCPFFRIQRAVLVVGVVCLLTIFTSIVFVDARNDNHVSANAAGPTVVTNTNDDGAGSLRSAILASNATAGLDTIVFDIPGPGVKVINPQTVLPEITDRVIIDGATQPGYAGTPVIMLDGNGLLFNLDWLSGPAEALFVDWRSFASVSQ
jgi:hypothetical protein